MAHLNYVGLKAIYLRQALMIICTFCGGFIGSLAQAATIAHETLQGDSGAVEAISVTGGIEDGDVDKFRQLALRHPKATVVLNSDGGKLFPALEIGKIIKISGYNTAVLDDAVCASSCALIWIAGHRRLVSENGHVGFHASYHDNHGQPQESGVANALIGNYLTLLDFRDRAIAFATSAPPDKILWLTEANKSEAGIDFEIIGSPEKRSHLQTFAAPSILPPSPIRQEAPVVRQHSALPAPFPANLFSRNENWIKFASNAYFDANSIGTEDRNDKNRITVWLATDFSSQKKEKTPIQFEMFSFDCVEKVYSVEFAKYIGKNGKTVFVDSHRTYEPKYYHLMLDKSIFSSRPLVTLFERLCV